MSNDTVPSVATDSTLTIEEFRDLYMRPAELQQALAFLQKLRERPRAGTAALRIRKKEAAT